MLPSTTDCFYASGRMWSDSRSRDGSSDDGSVDYAGESFDYCHVCGPDGWWQINRSTRKWPWGLHGWWCWACSNEHYGRSERTFYVGGPKKLFPSLQGHPREGHVYCNTCGLQSLMHRWKDAGWWCWACNNLTYWLREDIVFDRYAPTSFSTVGPLHRVRRYVDFCMLCHDTDGNIERDPLIVDYRYNHCNACSGVLHDAILTWTTEHRLPKEASSMILAFLELPRGYAWNLHPHYFRFWP